MYNSSSDLSLISKADALGSVSLNIPESQSQDPLSLSFYGIAFISPGPKS